MVVEDGEDWRGGGKGESRDVTVKIYNTAGAPNRERGKMERKIRSGSGMGEKAE